MLLRSTMVILKKWPTSKTHPAKLTIINSIHHREENESSFNQMKPIAKGATGRTVSYIEEPITIESPSIYPETLSVL
eukprot:7491855-Ditylum_brightwellii.AAC.2